MNQEVDLGMRIRAKALKTDYIAVHRVLLNRLPSQVPIKYIWAHEGIFIIVHSVISNESGLIAEKCL